MCASLVILGYLKLLSQTSKVITYYSCVRENGNDDSLFSFDSFDVQGEISNRAVKKN